MTTQFQTDLRSTSGKWILTVSKNWDVLGPFPIHAREQMFLSPSYPINLSKPINFKSVWPSSYADNAVVGWSKTQLSNDGVLTVAFPEIRWERLRATEGWAALQHHAVLRGILTLIPPAKAGSEVAVPRILIQLKQGSYFTILPINETQRTPEWYLGNIYDMEQALPRVVNLPTSPDPTNPTEYEILISGDYEIRLFGDPHVMNTEVPTQVISLSVEVESDQMTVQRESSQDVICDFVDGLAFGEVIGIGFRSSVWSTVTHVVSQCSEIHFDLKQPTRVAPSQVRIVPLVILQHQVFRGDSLDVVVIIAYGSDQELEMAVSLPIKQRNSTEAPEHVAFKATYLYNSTMPAAFMAIPPVKHPQKSSPPILALHGAGVDISTSPFWPEALPPNNFSWTVVPSGRTSWGLDWHGPSAQDALNSIDALADILKYFHVWRDTSFKAGTKVIIIGHSNGGQGAWYIGARFPDRILGLIPAAGYIKSQAYVPLSMSRSGHFIDPFLRAILETSLTPDDNDLFMTNITNKPILVVHGGDDDNVPVWHGRESFGIVETWNRILGTTSDIVMKEDKSQLHFYPAVFNNPQVRDFINGLLESSQDRPESFEPFTLTVFRPEESGSLYGWRIEKVRVPGRLGRLVVTFSSCHTIEVHTTNVCLFSIAELPNSFSALHIDGNIFILDSSIKEQPLLCEREISFQWKLVDNQPQIPVPSPPTRMQSFLSNNGTVTFIQPSSKQDLPKNFTSLAYRLAHDLHVYHRLDSQIVEMTDKTELTWPDGNIVLIGTLSDPLIRYVLSQGKTPLAIQGDHLTLNGHNLNTDIHTGLIFLHPHPTSSDALIMFVIGESAEALERAARLFPIRTGITVPSWIILGSAMNELGAAGITGAGIWGSAWTWNDAVSWSESF